MKGLMSAREAGEILGVSRTRVNQLIRAGILPTAGLMAGAHVLRRDDVERLAREGWPGRRSP